MMRVLKVIVYMQDPLDISNCYELDLDKFRVKWEPLLVVAILDHVQEVDRIAPIWEQEQRERWRRIDKENNEKIQDFNLA